MAFLVGIWIDEKSTTRENIRTCIVYFCQFALRNSRLLTFQDGRKNGFKNIIDFRLVLYCRYRVVSIRPDLISMFGIHSYYIASITSVEVLILVLVSC